MDGVPKGIVVVKGLPGSKIDASKELEEVTEALSEDKSYAQYMKDIDAISAVYKRFADQINRSAWAELSLLILSDDCKGMGLGRKAIEEAEKVAAEKGKTGLFFYTDSDCNFGFYDHIGAVRVGYEDALWSGEPIRVFAYYLQY